MCQALAIETPDPQFILSNNLLQVYADPIARSQDRSAKIEEEELGNARAA